MITSNKSLKDITRLVSAKIKNSFDPEDMQRQLNEGCAILEINSSMVGSSGIYLDNKNSNHTARIPLKGDKVTGKVLENIMKSKFKINEIYYSSKQYYVELLIDKNTYEKLIKIKPN